MGFVITPYLPETNKFQHVFINKDGWLYASNQAPGIAHFEAYNYKGVKYLKFCAWEGQGYDGHYLSVDKNGFLGIYNWTGATGWKLDGDNHLVSDYNGCNVAISVSDGSRYKADNHWPGLRFRKEDNADLWLALA